ncbi:MAG: 5-oxoprolinase subunit PxpB [Chloroflexota bacterium]
MPPRSAAIHAFGEAAALVETEGPAEAQALAASLRHAQIPWLVGAVPGLSSLLVEFDPRLVEAADVERELRASLGSPPSVSAAPGRHRTIPVVYGGELGPDLEEVAAMAHLLASDVVRVHADAELRVLFDGFAPGFAYLGDLPDALRVPRLATPRTRTPGGSVAIADAMSGIYPADLPGGWRVIGRTPIALFEPRRDPPAYLVPGDTVRFAPIVPADWDLHAGPRDDW